ncbi:DUF916 domain-containing protein [Pseudolactococcus insecticola]|uniref:Cell surface protein n=1 Tax=Pseudolactococcus insecticola TaxID=2709158 RepID=A0A6A0B8D0_9LACT|nr:DUF916 domain-containing protein [Lactococcus insecticola]GFH40654.1 cell surface protein [Lactococcus insecticola]
MKKALLLCVAVIGFIIAAPRLVRAEDVGYTVRTAQSELQVDTSKSYFDLRAKANQAFDLTIEIDNTSDTSGDFTVAVTNGMTSDNGSISYGISTQKLDAAMTMPFTSFAKVETPKVTVPAKSKKQVTIKVKMPATTFDGMILGAIYIEKPVAANAKKSGYTNQYAYAKAVVIKETDKTVHPDLKMPEVLVRKRNNQVEISATLENPAWINIKKMSLKAEIISKKTGKVVVTKTFSDYAVAPTTHFALNLLYDATKFPTGSYLFRVKATQTETMQHEWTLEKSFDIDATAISKKFADKQGFSITDKNDKVGLYILLGALTALVLGLFIFIIILLKRRKKEDDDENDDKKANITS